MTSTTDSNDQNLNTYYRDGEATLPDGETVKPGGFYIKDDDGAVVFQLFSQKESGGVTGTIIRGNNTVTLVTVNQSPDAPGANPNDHGEGRAMVQAESHKECKEFVNNKGEKITIPQHTQRVIIKEGFSINLTPLPDKQALKNESKENGFFVYDKEKRQELFRIYTVDKNGDSLEATHGHDREGRETPYIPKDDPAWVVTDISGDMYVEVDGSLYYGHLDPNDPVEIQLLESQAAVFWNAHRFIEHKRK